VRKLYPEATGYVYRFSCASVCASAANFQYAARALCGRLAGLESELETGYGLHLVGCMSVALVPSHCRALKELETVTSAGTVRLEGQKPGRLILHLAPQGIPQTRAVTY